MSDSSDLNLPQWARQWLDRDIDFITGMQFGLDVYTFINLMNLAYIVRTLHVGFRMKRVRRELASESSQRPQLQHEMHLLQVKSSRNSLAFASIYLFGVMVIAAVDGYISFVSLKDDITSNPDVWNSNYIIGLAAEVLSYCVVFATAFFVVPAVQVFGLFYFTRRHAKRSGETTLRTYIPIALSVSSGLAYVWAIMAFSVQALSSPLGDGVYRWVLLFATWGSALVWLDAGYALSAFSERLADRDLAMSSESLREVIELFKSAVYELHARGEPLPQHVAVVPNEQTALKSGLF